MRAHTRACSNMHGSGGAHLDSTEWYSANNVEKKEKRGNESESERERETERER